MVSSDLRVAVIGAGVSGLVAAHRLRQSDARVTVFEATGRVGGMVQTEWCGDWIVELGATSVALTPEPVDQLLERAAPAIRRVELNPDARRRYLVHRGRPVPVPASAAELIASPLLSVAGRLRLLREPFTPKGTAAEETVSQFAERRLGGEMAMHFIDPLITGVTGGDPAMVLAEHAIPRMVAMEQRSGSILKGRLRAARDARRLGLAKVAPPWSCAGGMEELPRMLASSLDGRIELNHEVVAIDPSPVGLTITTAGGGSREFDAVLVSLPAAALGRIAIGGLDLSLVASMPHESVVVVALGFRHDQVDHPLEGAGLLAASHEQRRLMSISFTSSLLPERAPAEHVLLTATLGGVFNRGLPALGDEALMETALTECGELLGIRGDPILTRISRWPNSLPQPVAGHSQRLAAANAVEASDGRIALTGTWRDGVSLGDVMAGGIRAAERLLASFEGHSN